MLIINTLQTSGLCALGEPHEIGACQEVDDDDKNQTSPAEKGEALDGCLGVAGDAGEPVDDGVGRHTYCMAL